MKSCRCRCGLAQCPSVLAHASQVKVHGDLWVEGVKGRCAYRGYQIHVAYAEAFQVVKEINGCFSDRNR